MPNLNKVMLMGHLGKDPETRYTTSGNAVCNFSLATSEKWKDKQTGQPVERTEWHNVVMYGKLAEIAAEFLKKGAPAYIEGRIQTRKWQDKEGRDRYTTEIIADEMQMLGGKRHKEREPTSGGADPNDDVPFAPHQAGWAA